MNFCFWKRLTPKFQGKLYSYFKNFSSMKIPEDQMQHVLSSEVLILSDVFTRNGFEIRLAGGAVRDLVMGKVPTDLDFATTATPTEMKKMFDDESIRIINLGGEKHGTITARIEEKNFECTTLRIDKTTDGRHAQVEFIQDWELDAGRRDLTINALFLGLDGTVYDYFDGINDIKNRKVRFVGDPDQRIQEDYLRILRYFRFFGRVSDDPQKHDPSIEDSIKRNCEGLSRISGERIWIEMKKIVTGRFGAELTAKMVELGVGTHIGLPLDFDSVNLMKVNSRLKNQEIYPCTLLASGFLNESAANDFIRRVKCSNKEKDNLLFIINRREKFSQVKSVKELKDILVDMVYKENKGKDLVLFIVNELVKYTGRADLVNEVTLELIPQFPVKGGMLVDKVGKKYQIQREMRRLLDIWKESNYLLDRDELLSKVKT